MASTPNVASRWRIASRHGAVAGRAAALVVLALHGESAFAGDGTVAREFWPEIDAYYGIDDRSRLMFSAAATREMEAEVEGRATTFQNAQFTFNYDYTLEPILRKDVPQAEWSKNRLLWTRLGFEYGTSASSGGDAYRSYTGIVELNSRLPIGEELWLTSRLRADFRHVNGEPSQRYRIRGGMEWKTAAFDHPYSPYASVELLYDTRYGQWSRTTLKAGFETPIAADWRVEPYIALQLNKPADDINRVLGFGLTFKYYFP